MSRTQIRGTQVLDNTLQSIDIEDGAIWREDLNITSTGHAVVRKIVAGSNISIISTGIDDGTGDVTINFNSSTGGITLEEHRALNQLVHEIAEDNYCEINRTGGRISSIIYYTNSSKTTKIRSIDYIRTSNRLYQTIIKQYDNSGNLLTGETLTGTITRTNGRISSVTWVRT